VVAGSQMNEGDTARAQEERRPQPSDARESKGIQHEADLMLAPYRPAYWVEIRKPLDLPPGAPDWQKWISDLKAVRNRFELLVLKNRHGRKKDFELYCEMGASAIRDSEPRRRLSVEDEYARDLLEGLVS
jgi:replicative DNA helicase